MVSMLYKFGTTKELEAIKGKIPDTLYQTALNIVKALDENYGENRDVDEEDGGFCLVLQNVQDIQEAADWHIRLDKGTHEYVNLVKCADGDYLNVLYLMNNEFGVNVFLPKDITPKILLEDLEDEDGQNKILTAKNGDNSNP
jgi:hypothetical protein